MNLRIFILVTCFFVNVFGDQSHWIIHDNDKEWNYDNVDFMSQELLIPVKTQTVHKPKPVKVTSVPSKPQKTQSKPELVQSKSKPVAKDIKQIVEKTKAHPVVKSKKVVVEEENDELSSNEFILVHHKKPASKSSPVAKKSPVKSKSVSPNKVPAVAAAPVAPVRHVSPCTQKDVKCQIATEHLLTGSSKHPSTPTPRLVHKGFVPPSRAAVQAHKVAESQIKAGEHAQRHLLLVEQEEPQDNDDDILQSISDEQVKRYRRQVTAPNDGGSGTGFFEETVETIPSSELEFEIKQSINLATPVTTTFTESDKALYKAQFQAKLEQIYGGFPGFKRIDITDVKLNSAGQPTVDFAIVLDGGAIGAFGGTPEERLANITGKIRDAGDIYSNAGKVLGDNIIPPPDFNLDLFSKQIELLISDVCKSTNACPAGYHCIVNMTDTGDYDAGECTHKCVSTKLNKLCQNNALCTLDGNNEPYCQCGTSHSGFFCENEGPQDAGSLSTAEIVGITTGTLLAVAAIASCCFFLLFCRKSGKDMEYSYYGDDDNLMEGYMDQASNLGISNMYIDRPRVSIQPLDIYNDPTLGASA